MVGLGDFPEGDFDSWASDVSADGLVVTGTGTSALGREAFLWKNGVMSGLGYLHGGGEYSDASGISTNGLVVLGSSGSLSGREAFRWTQSNGMIGLGDLPGGNFGSVARASSADGSVVVGWGTSNLGQEAFIWDSTNGMQNFKNLLEDDYGLDLTGWLLTAAYDVSDNALMVVGHGINPDGYEEAWIATIPEPTTLLLLTFGVVFLRKRQNPHHF